MADTVKTLTDLLTALPLNTDRLIKPQNLRDLAVSVMSQTTLNIWDAKSHVIANVTDPGSAQDAATKNYVDNKVSAAFGTPPDYSSFESDGTLVFHGNATVWDDQAISGVAVRGGASAPSFKPLSTTGLYLYAFSDNHGADETLYFTVQMPHGRLSGSDLDFHIHLVPSANGSVGADAAHFRFTYQWVDINGIFSGTSSTEPLTITVGAADALKHLLVSFSDIAGSGHTGLSSILTVALTRLSKTDSATETYTGDLFLLSADCHVPRDTVGSRQELSK